MLQQRKSAFTIIELMVVVSIIMILISMLVPTIRQSIKFTEDNTCKSKQKSIHAAMMAYAWDNDNKFVASRQWVHWGWDNPDNVKNGHLFSYMNQDYEAYICPVFADVYKNYPGNENREVAYSYSMNEYLGNRWQQGKWLEYVNAVQSPSSLLMLTDENAWIVPPCSRYTINNGALGVGWYHSSSVVDSIGTFHDAPEENYDAGKSNVTFVDGHIEQRDVCESKELATPSQYK